GLRVGGDDESVVRGVGAEHGGVGVGAVERGEVPDGTAQVARAVRRPPVTDRFRRTGRIHTLPRPVVVRGGRSRGGILKWLGPPARSSVGAHFRTDREQPPMAWPKLMSRLRALTRTATRTAPQGSPGTRRRAGCRSRAALLWACGGYVILHLVFI